MDISSLSDKLIGYSKEPEEYLYFSEWVPLDTITADEAKTYLDVWKKTLVRKLYLEIIDESIVYREAFPGILASAATLGIKIKVKNPDWGRFFGARKEQSEHSIA